MCWSYDPETLCPRLAVVHSNGLARLQIGAQLLSAVGNPLAIATLDKLTTHHAHFVRWAALAALIDLDYARGLEKLSHTAEQDPHPHLRRAAARSLVALNAQP